MLLMTKLPLSPTRRLLFFAAGAVISSLTPAYVSTSSQNSSVALSRVGAQTNKAQNSKPRSHQTMSSSSLTPDLQTTRQGRLLARPRASVPAQTALQAPTQAPLPAAQQTPRQAAHGLQPLGLDRQRDVMLFVPSFYRADHAMPLVVSLHGAGGDAHNGLLPLQELAEESGFLLLSPASRQATWDVLHGGYGPDVTLIDRALTLVFERYHVDAQRLAIAGFSDGASYALSLGITNGDLFSHIIAFAPGFMAPASQQGSPPIYIAHGTHDKVLSIDRCSRQIVPQLRRAGYPVRYHEFEGPHTVPREIAAAAAQWLLSPEPATTRNG
ncbi:MAG: phospholipase/carboxylesterase [Abditibacteriota bacterium]|nr:phospholipase/carboxylesterase [Abditibacteriota bacterium]